MKKLNIFVDETGEFGFGKDASRLYGISFTFHEQNNDITTELKRLNQKLKQVGYYGMIHMADLIMKRGDYSNMKIEKRKSIFNGIYQFSRRISVKYRTILIDKKYIDNSKILKQQIINEINTMVVDNEKYFKKFDEIVMYYDNGQEILGVILESIFSRFKKFVHISDFDHVKKRLFQVSDMLTFIDKYDYKYKHNLKMTNGEKFFFSKDDIRKILKELSKKRF